jgi:hypothetical protein
MQRGAEFGRAKLQAPTSKHQRNSKLQTSNEWPSRIFGVWFLVLLWSLDVGGLELPLDINYVPHRALNGYLARMALVRILIDGYSLLDDC